MLSIYNLLPSCPQSITSCPQSITSFPQSTTSFPQSMQASLDIVRTLATIKRAVVQLTPLHHWSLRKKPWYTWITFYEPVQVSTPPIVPINSASHGLHNVQIAVIATRPPRIPAVNWATSNFLLYFLFNLQLYKMANNAPPIDPLIVFIAALLASIHFPWKDNKMQF